MTRLRARGGAGQVQAFTQRYLAYEIEGEPQKLPLLHVRLIGKNERFRTIALIDSGATVTFIPPELADAAGFDFVHKDVPAEGAGGSFMNDICSFLIEILKGSEVVHRMKGDAFVPKEANRVPYVVLGRDYLFRVYDITFRERQERVVLRRAKGSRE